MAKLSKTVLEMKFMKRTKERLLREEEEQNGPGELYAAALAAVVGSGKRATVEESLAGCLELRDGRFSCRGINPELERLQQLEIEAARPPPSEVDVTDQQMADFYNPLVATMADKFNSKRDKTKRKGQDENISNSPPVKKNKFMKPTV